MYGNGAAEPLRVLVADDNRDLVDSLCLLLELLRHQARGVYGGAAALEAARTFRPHVVLLDLGLPDLDGFAVARRLRTEAQLDGVLLVALTGWTREQDRQRAREAGFDHYLLKPVTTADLERLLASRPITTAAPQLQR
jgi:two-component system CheB/CheR fusion protein